MNYYPSPFVDGICPVCKQNTLSSSSHTDVCLNEDCGYGYIYTNYTYQREVEEDD